MKIDRRYTEILEYFQSNVPEPKSELQFRDDYQLLVAVMLSAQCTDRRINTARPNVR